MFRIFLKITYGEISCVRARIILTVSVIIFLCHIPLFTLLADSLASSEYSLSQKKYQVVPEYKRNLKRIVVSLKAGSSALDLHHKTAMSLPSYTKIYLLVSNDVYEEVRQSIEKTPYGNKTSVLMYDTEIKRGGILYLLDNAKGFAVKDIYVPIPLQIGTYWMQDIFIPVIAADRSMKLVTPPFHMCLWSKDKFLKDDLSCDNDFINSLLVYGVQKYEIPVVFNGGNIRFGEISGKLIAFCGSDILINTSILREISPENAAIDSIFTELITDAFGVDEVIIIDKGIKQPYYMFHLDQAFLIVDDGVACVTRVVENTKEYLKHKAGIDTIEKYLEEVRKTLSNSGFKIIDIDTPVHNIVRQEYYVNAVPFIDAETGEKKILMPVFEARIKSNTEILAENIKKLTSLGYQVIPVMIKENNLMGGLHCMVNVLD